MRVGEPTGDLAMAFAGWGYFARKASDKTPVALRFYCQAQADRLGLISLEWLYLRISAKMTEQVEGLRQ